ncbi:MAG TPA: ATP synthase F0 subunit B [Coriobacteriia bacterium]|nr:ATP synthase F0 subunit B [Coriobacteriia bacterium]
MQMNLNPLEQIDPVVIVAVAVIVLITFLVLKRVFVVPYVRVMEERALRFERADEQLADGRRLHESADAEADATMADARTEADELRRVSAEALERYRTETIAEAGRTAASRLERGRAAIQAQRAEEQGRLRDHAVSCVELACQQLIGGIGEQEVGAVVDDLMARVGVGGAGGVG